MVWGTILRKCLGKGREERRERIFSRKKKIKANGPCGDHHWILSVLDNRGRWGEWGGRRWILIAIDPRGVRCIQHVHPDQGILCGIYGIHRVYWRGRHKKIMRSTSGTSIFNSSSIFAKNNLSASMYSTARLVLSICSCLQGCSQELWFDASAVFLHMHLFDAGDGQRSLRWSGHLSLCSPTPLRLVLWYLALGALVGKGLPACLPRTLQSSPISHLKKYVIPFS